MKQRYSVRRFEATEVAERVGRLGAGPAAMGVGVSKGELLVMVRGADGEAWAGPVRASNPGQVVEAARRVGASGRALRVGMGSSGTYGDALRQALSDAGVGLRRVEAKRSRDYAGVFDDLAGPARRDGRGGDRGAVRDRALRRCSG